MSETRAITEEEFALQQRELGRSVHQHDGVWWDMVKPFYCKPVFDFRQIEPGRARPAVIRSWISYSHAVPEPEMASRSIDMMVLSGERLRNFGIKSLKDAKRARVRKGLSLVEIRRLNDLESLMDQVRDVNISQADRQWPSGGTGLPSSYYSRHYDVWRRQQLVEFSSPGREWWGGFREGQLICYMTLVHIEQVAIIRNVKSRTDALSLCPNDAMYFTVLGTIRDRQDCEMLVNGSSFTPSLDAFKERFGFQKTPLHIYTQHYRVYTRARRLFERAAGIRRAFRREGVPASEVTGQ
ncbi:MAG TPA: hypothetical protein VMH22_15085 [bacterium]|nr:hypothetical protein [bacterium]